MLTRRNPFNEMNVLFRDMDRLFRRSLWESEGIGGDPWSSRSLLPRLEADTTGTAFMPPLEVYQKDKDLIVRAELPGINPEDVDVSVVGNQLHIRGERKHTQEVNRADSYLCESSYGRFERTFTLPEGIKPEDVKASYQNGILEVRLPAKGLAAAHQVKIEGAPETKQIKRPAA